MKKILCVIIALLLIGCAKWRLIDAKHHLDLSKLETIPLDVFDLKTINQLYGKPDIIDFENNIVIYISEYELREPLDIIGDPLLLKDPLEYEIWYLVIHTDSSNTKYLKGELFKEHFKNSEVLSGYDREGKAIYKEIGVIQIKRLTYQDIKSHCKNVH